MIIPHFIHLQCENVIFSLLKNKPTNKENPTGIYHTLYISSFFQILMINKYPILVISIFPYKHDPILKTNYI
jgi:hypothetical protein